MLTPQNTALTIIDIQTRLTPSISNHEILVPKTAACIVACKLLDVPILVLQQYTKGLGDTTPPLQEALGEFTPIEKITFSAYQTEEFVKKLKESGKENVIITGIEAHVCVQLTVLELLQAGYSVYVAADCIGSRSNSDRLYAENRMAQAGAVITTLESILFELLVRADHPMRKEITKLIVAIGQKEQKLELYNKEVPFEWELSPGIIMTAQYTDKDQDYVCKSLLTHNVKNTNGLLKKPGVDINLYLKKGETVLGAIMCDSFNMSVYIDVLWLDESCRGKGYGKALIEQAEEIAKEDGCVFSHTSTFSYQSPEFYQACGYEVFAELRDYPDGIVQYFLKKKL